MKSTLLIISSLVLSVIISGCISKINDEERFRIEFKLISSIGYLENSSSDLNQFCAAVKFKNISHPSFDIVPYIEYSNKEHIYSFFIEVYDLNDREIDLSTFSHPDYFPAEMISFPIGSEIVDTICSNGIYKFKSKGSFKLRLVFDPDKYFRHNGEIISEKVYSNWDTITIK